MKLWSQCFPLLFAFKWIHVTFSHCLHSFCFLNIPLVKEAKERESHKETYMLPNVFIANMLIYIFILKEIQWTGGASTAASGELLVGPHRLWHSPPGSRRHQASWNFLIRDFPDRSFKNLKSRWNIFIKKNPKIPVFGTARHLQAKASKKQTFLGANKCAVHYI